MFSTLKAVTAIFRSSKFNTSRLDRGYEFMLSSNALYTVRKLIRSICEYEYNKANQESQKQIFKNLKVADLAFFNAQCDTSYLLTSFAFNRAVANYYGSGTNFIFPLNKEWQSIFAEYGIVTNRNACSFLWKSYRGIIIVKSSVTYFKFFLTTILEKLRKSKKVNIKNIGSANVYFYDISERNLPRLTNDIYEKNIVTWYKKIVLKDNKINVHHNVKNFDNKDSIALGYEFTYNKSLFFQADIFTELKNLLWWSNFFLKNIINPSIRIYLLVNFNEILKAKRVGDIIDNLDLNAVVFNNSIGSIKPLWAVLLERNEIQIDYVFYACYAEPADIDGNGPIDGFWALAIWENYYVVDEYQKHQLQNQLINTNSKITFETIPWWVDVNLPIPSLDKKTICLFDTILHGNLYTLGTLNQFGWHKPELATLYLHIVLEVAHDLGLTILYKFKRMKGKNIRNKKHWDAISKLLIEYKDIIIQVDDRISPERLIQNSSITISKPLSTTAIIARSLNKPTIYLDPTTAINKSDPALRGIIILSTKKELLYHITNLLNTFPSKETKI